MAMLCCNLGDLGEENDLTQTEPTKKTEVFL